jgi:iron complex transport system permease protein
LSKDWSCREFKERSLTEKKAYHHERKPVSAGTISAQEIEKAHRKKIAGLLLLLGLASLIALLAGRYPAPGLTNPLLFLEDRLARNLLTTLRLPRVVMALMLGLSLGAGGTVFQMLFSNPLVEPGFLGVSQGAAFGAALAIIVAGGAGWLIQLSAAFFAFAGLGASYLIARHFHFGGWTLRLVLAGITVSALFSAGVGILKVMADPLSQLPELTFWLLGGLWSVGWRGTAAILPVVLICNLILFAFRWRLNLLSMDDRTAFSLGMAPMRERLLILAAATAAVAAVVSLSGIVGWVGLIVPHISRRIFSADSRFSLPGAMLIGALFTIVCDTVARTLLPGEIPLGILTSLAGASLFIILLTRKREKRGR